MSDELYRENILDHYRNPRNFGKLAKPSVKCREFNPVCGDEIEISIKLKQGKVEDVKFTGQGCAISQASASLLTEHIKGKSLAQLKKLDKDDILNLLKIKVGPVRLKCALLSLKSLQGVLDEKARN